MGRGEHSRRVGLARALSKLGYCSRSQATELIRAGRIRLNGTVQRDPEAPVYLESDRIEVDKDIVEAESKQYLMLNKPRGVVTTASDEKGRDTVYSYVSGGLPWVAPVGRLDKASEGLLLMTNDSEWAARISDPETHLDKIYHVQAGAVVGETLLDAMIKGMRTENGEILRAKHVRVLRAGQHNTWLEIVLDQGKNRQIRRMLEQLDIEVLRLVRVAVGPLVLGKLPKGACRALSRDEKRAVDRAMKTPEPRPVFDVKR
jgi:23S rRNA pseudouridine2605 synthase